MPLISGHLSSGEGRRNDFLKVFIKRDVASLTVHLRQQMFALLLNHRLTNIRLRMQSVESIRWPALFNNLLKSYVAHLELHCPYHKVIAKKRSWNWPSKCHRNILTRANKKPVNLVFFFRFTCVPCPARFRPANVKFNSCTGRVYRFIAIRETGEFLNDVISIFTLLKRKIKSLTKKSPKITDITI